MFLVMLALRNMRWNMLLHHTHTLIIMFVLQVFMPFMSFMVSMCYNQIMITTLVVLVYMHQVQSDTPQEHHLIIHIPNPMDQDQ